METKEDLERSVDLTEHIKQWGSAKFFARKETEATHQSEHTLYFAADGEEGVEVVTGLDGWHEANRIAEELNAAIAPVIEKHSNKLKEALRRTLKL